MQAVQVIRAERAKQNSEKMLMDMEDKRMQRFLSLEKIQIRKELYLMRKEEIGMRELWEFKDLGKHEDKVTHAVLENTVKKGYAILDSKKFQEITKKTIDDAVKKKQENIKKALKNYKGPKEGKPKVLSHWDVFAMRKEMNAELSHAFVLKLTKDANKDI